MSTLMNQKNLQETFLLTILLAVLALSGCSSVTIFPAESWKLPAKESEESAMIVGRIGLEGGEPLKMNAVTFQLWGKVYFYSGKVPRGEKEFLMDNSYFVIPNIKPGQYWFSGFYANGAYNQLPANKKDFINLKPGEIKFVGSFNYEAGGSNSARSFFGIPGSFNLKPTAKPSELEMMRWLLRASDGSGWEPTIKQRIKLLDGSKNSSTRK